MISAIRAMKVPNYHKVITVILITTTSIAAEFNPILSLLWCTLQALIHCVSPVSVKSTNYFAPLQWETEAQKLPAHPDPDRISASPTHCRAAHMSSAALRDALWDSRWVKFFGFVSEFHNCAGKWKHPSETTSQAKNFSRRGDTA